MSIPLFELNHPARVPLAAEIHSRPFLNLQAPELLTHLAIYPSAPTDSSWNAQQHQAHLLQQLCLHFGVSPPAADAKYFYFDFGHFRLKWECHTEFATYTFALHVDEQQNPDVGIETLFTQMPIHQVPSAWLHALQGQVLVAAHVVLLAKTANSDRFLEQLQSVYRGNTLAASYVMHGAEFYSDFAIHADGYSRFVIRDVDMRSQQAGRLAQRILEIETYRMMALLGLPIAQKATPELNLIEQNLVELANAMVEADRELGATISPTADQADRSEQLEIISERSLLEQITHLAARIEKLSLQNSYRFAASKAYIRLVHARIDELREQRIEGMPMVVEFMDRRLTPAMNTCEAVANRQEALAQRIAHSNDLLRTRVGIVQEMQNRQILQSMNTRAAQQLHLQQAVEGLSVAAISYYVIGLFSYVAKAAKEFGWISHVEGPIGLGVPLVLGLVWIGLRRMHQRMKSKSKEQP